jgi:hypothetical protein
MMYIIRHHKARHSTNREFQVVHYLPQLDSQLLGTYLAYVRPFTDMLYRTCFDRTLDRHLFFASPGSKGKPWDCSILTKALKELTQRVCGVAFGVQVYRQLSIAVTERHIKQVSRPFDRYDDRSSEAKIEVAFAWQSGHRPLQRGTTYGIDAAYPDSLQPALLRVYEWASKEWHRFTKADKLPSVTLKTAARLSQPVEVPDTPYGRNNSSKRRASSTLRGRDAQRQRLSVSPSLPPQSGISSPSRLSDLSTSSHEESNINEACPFVHYLPNKLPTTSRVSVLHKKNNQPSSDDASSYLCYLPSYQVLICRKHTTAIHNLDKHLRVQHKVSLQKRRAILEEYKDWRIKPPEEVALPPPMAEPFQVLGDPIDGFQCQATGCKYVTINFNIFKSHCKQGHGISWNGDMSRTFQKVKVQTFFRGGVLQRYFVVRVLE